MVVLGKAPIWLITFCHKNPPAVLIGYGVLHFLSITAGWCGSAFLRSCRVHSKAGCVLGLGKHLCSLSSRGSQGSSKEVGKPKELSQTQHLEESPQLPVCKGSAGVDLALLMERAGSSLGELVSTLQKGSGVLIPFLNSK